MADLVFNEQQNAGIEQVVQWFKGFRLQQNFKQVFFLAGFAGTGKTSVAQRIAQLCGGEARVVFIAPTGKAAARLRQKGCKWAKTMHQFIYNVRGEDADGDPIFANKGALSEQPWLVILDEASMVGQYDLDNLKSHGIPILGLGDTGQVPPVKAAQVFSAGTEDFILDKIERQGADSNIIRASMFVRDGKRLPVREYDDVRVRSGRPSDEDLLDHTREDGVIICSYNNTREATNHRIRKLLGFDKLGDLPTKGEKVVCTFNQHSHGIMNGEQMIVEEIRDVPPEEQEDEDEVFLQILYGKSLTTGKMMSVKFNPMSFDRNPDTRKDALKSPGGFDFGWALTVHKSQGSEWDLVLVIEEILRGVPYAQMMYTAVTRAVQRLTIYRAT